MQFVQRVGQRGQHGDRYADLTQDPAFAFGEGLSYTWVDYADLHLDEGELIGLIGPNGAGKTTLFNLLTGVYPPSSGDISLTIDGKKTALGGMAPNKICAAGIGRTFQNIRLFKDRSVLDNVATALQQNLPYPLASALFHLPPFGDFHGQPLLLLEKIIWDFMIY